MGRLFGTDGVRGIANRELTAELTVRLARAAGQVIAGQKEGGERSLVLVGRDTRHSGEMLEAALAAGLCSAGLEVALAGVVPTAAVAFLVQAMPARAGAMISASHNPFEFNGIKFFSGDGFKLPDELEDRIQQVLEAHDPDSLPQGAEVGRLRSCPEARARYREHLLAQAQGSLAGLKLVVDCGNGAACGLAPEVLEKLGAKVTALAQEPDGVNINAGCGSLHPALLQGATRRSGADLGVAFDGDADRAVFSDEKGELVDGDQVLAMCARELRARGELASPVVVGTVMSNLGLELALREMGCRLVRAKVGDRYVLEEMQRTGARLGGEPSGHIIFFDRETTGDGLVTAILVAGLLPATGKRLSELAKVMTRLPQVIVNIPVREREAWKSDRGVKAAISDIEQQLGDRGRLVVRASGTEPLVRVMVEGEQEEEIRACAEKLAGAVRACGS
jgi:phosphoglucosamine mutase